jgi:hypothetical protein
MSMLALALTASLVLGQSGAENPYLRTALQQIRDFDEAAALRTLEQARGWPQNTPQILAQLSLYTALAHAGLSHEAQAIDAFRSALLLDPSIKLPPRMSPRIREWWVKAGGAPSSPDEPAPGDERAMTPEPVLVPSEPAPPRPEMRQAPETVAPAPAAPVPWGRWVGGGTAAVGLLALGAAVAVGSRVPGLDQQAQGATGMDQAGPLHTQAVHTAQAANILYGVGGGLALIGGVTWVWKF